eukprot:3203657-Rhodomonas_salina.1
MSHPQSGDSSGSLDGSAESKLQQQQKMTPFQPLLAQERVEGAHRGLVVAFQVSVGLGMESSQEKKFGAGNVVESAPKLASKMRVPIRNDAVWPTVDTDSTVLKALGHVHSVQVEVLPSWHLQAMSSGSLLRLSETMNKKL